MKTLVIVGIGYVGLPVALESARAGMDVVGLDRRPEIVQALNAGKSHIKDFSDLEAGELLQAGFRATTDATQIDGADVFALCVPTPLDADGVPDLGDVRAAAETVAKALRPGALVILESTTFPGTTDEVVLPILEAGSGLRGGVDFHLAFSPERIDTGNAVFGLRNTPKVVGGITDACTDLAVEFYGRVCDKVVRAKSAREAEMSKLIENTYRNVNIALANELAEVARALGVDIWDAIDCAATKPFGFHAFYPGPGVGGHCIPSDPVYLSHRSRSLGVPARLIETAGDVNAAMPRYVAERISAELGAHGKALNAARVLLAGVTYKQDSDDLTSTPAEPLARLLRARGAQVRYCDPNVTDWAVDGVPVDHVDDLVVGAADADLVVVLQWHREFDLDGIAAMRVPLMDTRGRLRDIAAGL